MIIFWLEWSIIPFEDDMSSYITVPKDSIKNLVELTNYFNNWRMQN